MRMWNVPAQITDEEKMIGGFMSFRQLAWLVFFFCLGGTGLVLPVRIIFKAAVFFAIFSAGAVFAFVRVWDMDMDVFLWRLLRYHRRPRELYLRGDE